MILLSMDHLSSLSSGAVMIEQQVPAPTPPIPVVPLAENPLVDDWLAAVDEYRNSRDAEERAAEVAISGS
jgi:hypothetical protein